MRQWTSVFTWMRSAVAGLVLCLALLLAVFIFTPVQAQAGCVDWDDHGNCVAWENVGHSTSQSVAAGPTATPLPTPQA